MSHRLTLIGHAILIGLAVYLLFPFFAIALYSSPFTDDFCLSSHSLHATLAEIAQYYFSASGRLPALLLITFPSDLAHLTGLDLYVVYPFVMLLLLVTFVSAMIASSILIFRRPSIGILFGLLFSTFAIGLVPSLNELVYWMPGAACYLTATVGACLYAAWLVMATVNDDPISRPALALAMAGCFIIAAFNEFTVFFLLGLTCLSVTVRMLSPKPIQLGSHLGIIAATCVGYCIILFSPGNPHRMGLFHQSGNIAASFANASTYSLEYAIYLSHLPEVQAFAGLTLCFAFVPQSRPFRQLPALAFAAGLIILAAIWVYTSYFIGAFSTGELIPLRSRNELLVVFLFSCSLSIILLVRSIVGFRLRQLCRFNFWIVAAGTIFILPIRYARNFDDLRAQWPQLATFWEESIARDLLLSSPTYDDVVVPRRTVFPSLLMGEELKEVSDVLPNDCVARYYGKSSVVLAPEH